MDRPPGRVAAHPMRRVRAADPALTVASVPTSLRLVDMRTIGAFEAKTHLSALLDDVERGERITITRHGVAIAVLSPAAPEPAIRAHAAAQRIRELRQGVTLGDVTVRELIDEGRR